MELAKKIIRLFHPLRISGFDPKADAGRHHGMNPRVLVQGFLSLRLGKR